MKPIKSKKTDLRPIKFWTSDIETYIRTHKLRFICAYTLVKNEEHKLWFTSMADFFTHFLSKSVNKWYGKYIIYMHFGGGFDFNYILDEIFRNDDFNVQKLDSILSGSLLIYLSLNVNGVVFEFRDSYALFRKDLDSVAQALINKGKSLDLSAVDLDKKHDSEVIDYCINDCKILYESIEAYRKLINAPIKLTGASQAYDQFCRYFLDKEWRKLREQEINVIKSFAYAGRVDVFKRAGKDIAFLDINNCYPFVMKKWGSPVGTPCYVKSVHTDKIGFYRIELREDTDFYIPFLAKRIKNKLYFVNADKGTQFNITTHELDLLLSQRIKFRVLYGYEYEKDTDFFADYVDFWISIRNENEAMKFLSKNMLNHLSGKFFQKTNFKKIKYIPEDSDESKLKLLYFDPELRLAYIEEEDVIRHLNNPQISSWIWSGGRRILWHYLTKYQESVCYCDTDSVAISADNIDYNDVDNTIMGKCKIERKAQKIIFLSQKFYGWFDKNGLFHFKIKGFDRKGFSYDGLGNKIADTPVTWDDFYKALHYNELKFEIEKVRLAGVRIAIKSHDYLSYTTMRKHAQRIELKRKLLPDKLNTRAYRLTIQDKLT